MPPKRCTSAHSRKHPHLRRIPRFDSLNSWEYARPYTFLNYATLKHFPARSRTQMAVKVGINGFGRIGRNIFRSALGNKDIEFVAVNDLTTPATLAHLLKYDSILGNLPNQVSHTENSLTVDGKTIKVFAERDPAKLDWASVGAEIVISPSPSPSPSPSAPPARHTRAADRNASGCELIPAGGPDSCNMTAQFGAISVRARPHAVTARSNRRSRTCGAPRCRTLPGG